MGIAQSLDFRSWKEVLEAFNRETDYPPEHFNTLFQAERVYLRGERIDFGSAESKLQVGGRKFRAFLNGEVVRPTPLIAVFVCRNSSCGKEFKVEYNPARCYLNSFLCKRCKKSVLHSCKDSTENYEASMLKTYGVRRPIQNKEIHTRFTQTMVERYGVRYTGESTELRSKTICQGGQSVGELELAAKLQERYGSDQVKSEVNQKIQVSPLRWLYPDILVGDHQVVEYNGDYWHGNPEVYGPEDMVSNGYLAKEVWRFDQERIVLLEGVGYETLIVWERDWKRKRQETWENLQKWIKLP